MMTFDNGTSTRQSTASEITESMIRLLVQGMITLGVMGGWIWAVTQQLNVATTLQPIVIILMAFWFGEGALSTLIGYKRDAQHLALRQVTEKNRE